MVKPNLTIASFGLIPLFFIAYLVWSLMTLYKFQQALTLEKDRVYSIADHLQFWKNISIRIVDILILISSIKTKEILG
jgi:hypothetical protein